MALRSGIAKYREATAPWWRALTSPWKEPWQKRYGKAIPPPKYTLEPVGIWARVHKLLAVDSTRSSGIPLNAQFRNPPPGALDPNTYDDPVTLPAADIAGNPYWKRDNRRGYALPSTVTQGDVVALLSVGSKASPKEDILQLGDAGKKQLVEVKKEGEEKGLAAFFEKQKSVAGSVLGPDGLPPLPAPLHAPEVIRYELSWEQPYPEKYPCRTFI